MKKLGDLSSCTVPLPGTNGEERVYEGHGSVWYNCTSLVSFRTHFDSRLLYELLGPGARLNYFSLAIDAPGRGFF